MKGVQKTIFSKPLVSYKVSGPNFVKAYIEITTNVRFFSPHILLFKFYTRSTQHVLYKDIQNMFIYTEKTHKNKSSLVIKTK